MAASCPQIGKTQAFQLPQTPDFAPKLGLGAGIEDVDDTSALSFHDLARTQLVENGKRRNLPHRGVGPGPMEMQLVLAVNLVQLIFGKAERGEPVDEVGQKLWCLAEKRIPGEPYQLFFGEPDGAGVIELGAQLSLVDHLGESHMPAAIDDRKGDALVRVEFPNHLLHQQLVEIGIEQAAHDRVKPPAVVVGPGCNICHCHAGTLPRRGRRNQWVSPAAWLFSALFPAGYARWWRGYRSRQAYPGQIAAADRRRGRRPGRRKNCP